MSSPHHPCKEKCKYHVCNATKEELLNPVGKLPRNPEDPCPVPGCGHSIGLHKLAAHSSASSVSSSSEVSVITAVRTGAAASARHFLERFCDKFTDKHANDPSFTSSCGISLGDMSNTRILEHFEKCSAVTKDEHLLLGDAFTMELQKKNIKLPTAGSLSKVYQKLSEIIHSDCIYSRDGKVIVPARLSEREKRFFIRFLIADGEGVLIVEDDGTLRNPHTVGEIETPPPSPPLSSQSGGAASTNTQAHAFKQQAEQHEAEQDEAEQDEAETTPPKKKRKSNNKNQESSNKKNKKSSNKKNKK